MTSDLLQAVPKPVPDFWNSYFSIIILDSCSAPEKPGNQPFLLFRGSCSKIVLEHITEKPGLPASPLFPLRGGSPLEKVATGGLADLLSEDA
jgi:hypothetical protein